ncbi:MAG: HlyD family efflux transporter periplasmic adaptor subunit [Planctomycetota bacterium]
MTDLFRRWKICLILATLFLQAGCQPAETVAIKRRPRPVAVKRLIRQMPPNAALVTASAGSWKTEDLGFEVTGRVVFVAEQNTEIEGRIRDATGKLLVDGTPIARIESERYELAVANAEASVARAEQDLIVGQTELDETIPAQISAATASVELAKVEYDRSKRLRSQNAGSQSALDSAKANYENAVAEVKQLLAAEKAQKSQIESLKSGVAQAYQSLRDAKRDLEDCTLYSSFRGKIASTAVVPGSLVSAGTPVVTLQMMDPIKIELEVSGERSRELQRSETLPVHVTMPDGSIKIYEGFLHQIDPSADPLTRTFTVTILVLNQLLTNVSASESASTQDIWRLDLPFIPGAQEGDLFVEENALLNDAEGSYLWQITNATIQSRAPRDNILTVRRLRVFPTELKVPYLGDLVFRQVRIADEAFDPKQNLVIGKLNIEGVEPNRWNGNEVFLDSPSRWLLRPGDLVEVDLSGGQGAPGYYVPMDAIARRRGESFLFTVDSSADRPVVKRVPVTTDDGSSDSTTSSLRRVEPIGDVTLESVEYVTKGTHFLSDGEPVNPIADSESDQ